MNYVLHPASKASSLLTTFPCPYLNGYTIHHLSIRVFNINRSNAEVYKHDILRNQEFNPTLGTMLEIYTEIQSTVAL